MENKTNDEFILVKLISGENNLGIFDFEALKYGTSSGIKGFG